MENITQYISTLFSEWKNAQPTRIEVIAKAGGDRQYFRLFLGENESYIATYNPNHIAENEAFIYFSACFNELELPVPKVLHISPKKEVYFQTDAGNEALLDVLNREKYSENVYQLYQKSLQNLAKLQIKGDEKVDYSKCLNTQHFDKQVIDYDLRYFFFYFVHPQMAHYNRTSLFKDFEQFADFLMAEKNQYFLYRDFQSRNILVNQNEVYFIDYQAGMKGALQYDVVSLLWQAKAALPTEWKESLLDFYFEEANKLLEGKLNKTDFYEKYKGFVLVRMLQTLGSYGYRGLFERRPYFLSAIPFALKQLRNFMKNNDFPLELPTLTHIIHHLTSDEMIHKFTHIVATEKSKLKIKIKSFSYKKGIPKDESGNGGGFVFDCRGLLNPGRFTPYKTLTGRDEPVQTFLMTQSEMPTFLQHIYPTIDISVQNYLERDFDSLSIYFGCTGGQHRSVFAADSVAKYLKNKYHVNIEVEHVERGWAKEDM